MSVSSYDPDEGRTVPSDRKKRNRRPSGPKKPTNWLPPSAREEDPDDPDHVPQPLTEEQHRKLRERCMNLCLWHLGQGPRTRKQLTDAMAKHAAPAEVIEATLAKLEEYNYVNDVQFADNLVASRVRVQRKGSLVIRQELRRKGVAAETIATALEAVGEDTEVANARVLVEKKLSSTRGLDRQKRVTRLVGMLARKGYHGGIAFAVVRDALNAEEPEEEDFEPR